MGKSAKVTFLGCWKYTNPGPKTITFLHLKMDGWNMLEYDCFLLGRFGLFSGANLLLVSGRGLSWPEPQRLWPPTPCRIKIRQHRRCCHLPHGLDMWPLGRQKNLGTKITTNRSPWRAKVADRSWLDGVQCGYFQDFVEVSTSNCTRCKLHSNEILGDFVSCKLSNHLKHIS